MADLWIAKQLPKATKALSAEAPGRAAGRTAGGFISDLTAVKQCILLCEFCQHRFDAKRNGYRKWKDTYVVARCDGCKSHSIRATAFVHEDNFHVVERDRPKRGRWTL